MLAVRGGLRDQYAWRRSTWTGRLVQHWILSSLASAPFLAFVSQYTRADLLRLAPVPLSSDLGVVLSPLNSPFSPSVDLEILGSREPQLIVSPYLLMVGSSLARKNRETAFLVLAELAGRWDGLLVLAGSALTREQNYLVHQLGLAGRIVEIMHPDHALLNALYVQAHALLFPSRAEGFGWPVIEAQQCECPVICSSATAVPEVAGVGAIICDPDDVPAMASAVISLENPAIRSRMIEKGRANLARFDPAAFRSQYRAFYEHIISSRW
jgi:glycosyltransferase involved in cell wall biosynthesis